MRLTAVGIRNYQDKVEARQDQREKTIMDLYAKGGASSIAKLFNRSTVNNRGIQLFNRNDEDDITQTSLGPTMGDSYVFGQSTREAAFMEDLKENFGLDENTAAKFMANGDPTVFERLHKKIKEAQKFYEVQDKPFARSPVSEKFIGTIIEGSVAQAATPSGRIDIKKVEDYIGRELDGLYKGILQQEEMPRGQIILGDKFLGEDFTQPQITNFILNATSATASMAKRHSRQLGNKIRKFLDITEGYVTDPSGARTKTTARNLTEAEHIEKRFYIDYRQQLDSAIEAFEDDDNPLELFLIYGAKGLEQYLKQSPKLARDTLVNEYLEAAKDRDYIFTPAIPGRPTELVPFSIQKHKDLLDAGPSAYSFIYQLLYVDEIFTVGDKVVVYDGDLEAPNVIHSYVIKDTKASK